jgi:hypothetical protein
MKSISSSSLRENAEDIGQRYLELSYLGRIWRAPLPVLFRAFNSHSFEAQKPLVSVVRHSFVRFSSREVRLV